MSYLGCIRPAITDINNAAGDSTVRPLWNCASSIHSRHALVWFPARYWDADLLRKCPPTFSYDRQHAAFGSDIYLLRLPAMLLSVEEGRLAYLHTAIPLHLVFCRYGKLTWPVAEALAETNIRNLQSSVSCIRTPAKFVTLPRFWQPPPGDHASNSLAPAWPLVKNKLHLVFVAAVAATATTASAYNAAQCRCRLSLRWPPLPHSAGRPTGR